MRVQVVHAMQVLVVLASLVQVVKLKIVLSFVSKVNMKGFALVLITMMLSDSHEAAFAADCEFNIRDFLKKTLSHSPPQGAPGKIDFESIVKRIESGELTMERIKGQSVSRVIGLEPHEDVFVRSNFTKNVGKARGYDTVGIDVSTRQKRDFQFYKLSRYLEYDSVPETVLTKINGEEVSITARVYGREFTTEREYHRYMTGRIIHGKTGYLHHKQDLENLAILDMVGGNMDRNITNLIFDEQRNRIMAIDHADVLPAKQKVPHVQWFWTEYGPGASLPLSEESLKKIRDLDSKKITDLLRKDQLLEPKAYLQMERRIEFMKEFVNKHPEATIQDMGHELESIMIDW
jgi:hypothetical protein